MPEETAKRKLTLSVHGDIIEKAKSLDLNISEITEGVLRGFAFKPSDLEKESLAEAYKALFDSMKGLLRDYMTGVCVGETSTSKDETYMVDIRFNGKGKFWISDAGTEMKFDELSAYDFYEPKRILSNFIRAIANASEKRNERLAELKMAKGIIDAIAGSVKGGNQAEKNR